MPIPSITHQQFLVLSALGGRERPGREIREALQRERVRHSLPAFYQMMSRMQDAGLVEARFVRADVEGQAVQERWYKATGAGLKAWAQARDFYIDAARFAGEGLADA